MATRDEQIVRMRRKGASLAKIAEQFGLSSERVRQIAAASFGRDCACCGAAFETTMSHQIYCGSCACATCGSPVPASRVRPNVGRNAYCSSECVPGYVGPRGASGGSRFRRVELGIYVKRYITTGIEPDGFYCFDQVHKTWVRFDTLELARAYRASGAWSRRAMSGTPGKERA